MRFLLVEDDPTTEDLLARILRSDRHDVDVISTARSAAEAIRCNTYDVAMVDWVLAGETGMEAIRAAVAEGVPMILLATAAPRSMVPDALLAEMDRCGVRFLQKPFDLTGVYDAIGLPTTTGSQAT